MNLTLQQVFGANCVQDANVVVITKSDLLGLLTTHYDSPSSVFAAIINTAHRNFEGHLSDENDDFVVDEDGIPLTYDNRYVYTATWVIFWGYLFPKGRLNSVVLLEKLTPYILP